MSGQIFDEAAWRAVCEKCTKQAMRGTGMSETLFARNLYDEIGEQLRSLAPEHHALALGIARGFGYLDSEELEADAQWNADHGYCAHGIALNYCPLGCETDESEDEFDSDFDDLRVPHDASGDEIC